MTGEQPPVDAIVDIVSSGQLASAAAFAVSIIDALPEVSLPQRAVAGEVAFALAWFDYFVHLLACPGSTASQYRWTQ
jgi:hypothetical protein